jgi:hypothetical protein
MIWERMIAGLAFAAPMIVIACLCLARVENKRGGHDGW